MKDWTESERERQAAVLAGKTIVANGTKAPTKRWSRGRKRKGDTSLSLADPRRLEGS